MKTLRHYLSVLYGTIKVSVLNQLEYPAYFICWFIAIPIQYFAGISMIAAVSKQFGSIGGYGYGEIIFLYGLGLISHGLMVVFFIQTWNIDRMILRGGFDRMLLRPMSVVFQFCTDYFNFIGLIDLIPGVVIFIYGCNVVGFTWSLFNILKLALVLAGAVMIRASFYLLIGCISFWAKGSRALVGAGELFLQRTTMYPMSVYPMIFQFVFTFIIPVGFIAFYPAAEFLQKNGSVAFHLGFALLTPIAGLLMSSFTILLFKIGLRRYESAGS